MRRFLGVVLLTFALLQLGFRGMQRVRSEVPLWDFGNVYCASRTWVHGGNPYDKVAVLATWQASGSFADRDVSYFATVYPPTSLLMLVPLSLLPVGAAMGLWLAITIALLILQFLALADMAGLRWRDPLTLILVAASLASAPLQFGILSGQLSLVALSACIVAFWCVSRDREKLGGVLLGLACALKPQLAGPFVLYYIVRRREVVSMTSIVVGGTICAAALAAMHLSHVSWLAGWMQSIAATGQVGGVNDYGWAGDFRDEIVDLKLIFVSLLRNPQMLRLAVEGIVIMLGVSYVRWFPRGMRRSDRYELLGLAGLSAISLLAMYHRVYDIGLLTTALAWALAEFDGPRRRFAVALLIPMTVFLIPFDIVLTAGRHVPRLLAVSKSAWWQSLLAPHYAWGLLAMTICILWILRGLSHSARPGGAISQGARPAPEIQQSSART